MSAHVFDDNIRCMQPFEKVANAYRAQVDQSQLLRRGYIPGKGVLQAKTWETLPGLR